MSVTIMNAADCRSVIAEICTNAKNLQARIHGAAVSSLAHIRDHGDWTIAAELLGALPSGQRVNGLILWFGKFSNGKVSFRKDKESGKFTAKLEADRKPTDFDIEGAGAIDYGDLTAEPKQARINLKALENMIRRVADNDKLVKGTNVPVVDEDARIAALKLLTSLREMRSAIKAA